MAQSTPIAQRTRTPRPSRAALSLFSLYLSWYIGRHFHALRLAHSSRFPGHSKPLIVCLNHASWWDPLACIVLSRYWLKDADHFAPMDAAAMERYKFMRKLGLFPVESGTARGAAQFLKAADEILSSPNSVLWITPEGRFTDVRTRPVIFRSGLAALISRLGGCTVLPVAIEYTFWGERLPEILALCGKPLAIEDGRVHAAQQWNRRLTAAMEEAQDELAALSALRDTSKFETVLDGVAGVGGIYDIWRRLRAQAGGRPFIAEHESSRRA